jgi:hypothetical protein
MSTLNKQNHIDPKMQELYFIRGILRNRLSSINGNFALGLLRKSVKLGAPIESLKTLAREAKNWGEWRMSMEAYIEQLLELHRQKETPQAETKPVESSENSNESSTQ